MWDESRRHAIWRPIWRSAAAIVGRSALLEGLAAFDFPTALARAASGPTEPVLRFAVNIARHEIAARLAAFDVGGGERGDISAGAGIRILPGHAGTLAVMGQHVRGGR